VQHVPKGAGLAQAARHRARNDPHRADAALEGATQARVVARQVLDRAKSASGLN